MRCRCASLWPHCTEKPCLQNLLQKKFNLEKEGNRVGAFLHKEKGTEQNRTAHVGSLYMDSHCTVNTAKVWSSEEVYKKTSNFFSPQRYLHSIDHFFWCLRPPMNGDAFALFNFSFFFFLPTKLDSKEKWYYRVRSPNHPSNRRSVHINETTLPILLFPPPPPFFLAPPDGCLQCK